MLHLCLCLKVPVAAVTVKWYFVPTNILSANFRQKYSMNNFDQNVLGNFCDPHHLPSFKILRLCCHRHHNYATISG